MFGRRKGADAQKLGWLLLVRLLLALFSIALIAVISGESLTKSSYYPAYYLLVFVCVVDLGYLLIYRLRGGSEVFTALQIGIDVFFVTVLIFLSGASRSPFSFLYYAVVLAAASLISRRSALFFASLATVLLAGVTTSYYLANQYELFLPFVSRDWVERAGMDFGSMLGYLVAQGAALHLVAFLSGQLAVRAADVRALYGPILDNMIQGVLVVDPDDRILYTNREAARLLGITHSAYLVQRKVEEVLPDDNEARLKWNLGFGGEKGEVGSEASDADSPLKNVDIKTSALRSSRGRKLGTIVLLTDLTLRRRLEESQKRVEHLQEIEEMSAGLAHEIRNPLASIRGCTQELGKQELSEPTNKKLAEIVCRESDRLDKIVNDFLNLARMKPPVFSRTELDSLVDEVVILLRSREDAAEVQILQDVEEKMHIYCDPEQVRQLLLNFGINSIEALDRHGYIKFTAYRDSRKDDTFKNRGLIDPGVEGYVIEVVDNGCGISPEDIPKVFTPFFTTKQRGTGMGLAIANRIVTEHGGLMEVDSEKGKGTSLRLWLPLYPRTALRRTTRP